MLEQRMIDTITKKENFNKYYRDIYYPKNKEIILEKNKIWRKNNPNKMNIYLKEWRNKNIDKCRELNNQWIKNHREYINKRDKQYYQKYKDQWYEIIKNKNMHFCSKCGYSKCFAAIDFHHIKIKEKGNNLAIIMRRKPTEERIAELDKCIALCANCHRELHYMDNVKEDL